MCLYYIYLLELIFYEVGFPISENFIIWICELFTCTLKPCNNKACNITKVKKLAINYILTYIFEWHYYNL